MKFYRNKGTTIISNGEETYISVGVYFFNIKYVTLFEEQLGDTMQGVIGNPEFEVDTLDSNTILNYLRRVDKDNEQLIQMLADSKDARSAFEYCNMLGVNQTLRQVILDSGEPELAYDYCKSLFNNEDMRQVIIDSKDSFYAYLYCLNISNDDDMKQVIIDNKDTTFAYLYCKNISNDREMLNELR